MFADFAHFGFPRRVCCLKSKTFVVKDRPFLPGTRQNPTRHSDRIGSPLSQGRTSVASHATDPLMGGIREYPSPLLCQITFRKIYSGERSPRRLGFSRPPKPPSGNSLSAFQFSAE